MKNIWVQYLISKRLTKSLLICISKSYFYWYCCVLSLVKHAHMARKHFIPYHFKISYNPRQNYLRKFSPSCPISYVTKLFPKWGLCREKSPFPTSMLLPTNAQGSGFLLNRQQHCFEGKGERKNCEQLRCSEKCSSSIQFIFSTVLSKIVADIPSY